ncbi:MAG: hypothetical protein K5669_02990 [Lachnospiraceae bacterium]|nr:hypothetical protein [Lachnospiraceae bacterium]
MATNNNENSENNIFRFKKKRQVNITLILFCLILVYVIIVGIIYLRKTHTVRYEVTQGALASSTIYRGVVLRDEILVNNTTPGYVNYLAREGQRIAVGDLVYTVDETGTLNEYIESLSLGENSLTDKELSEFRTDIINFVHGYNPADFGEIYNFKYSLKNTVLKLSNTKLLNNMAQASDSTKAVSLKYIYAGNTGIISYWYDGYEGMLPEMVTKDVFKEKDYQRTQLLSNELRGADESVYKINLGEDWSVVIPIDKDLGEELLNEDYIKVKFLKNQYESWGKVSLMDNEDGYYLCLSFTNSLITFVNERFLDIELELGDETGLKIPISSIAEKEFFLIDEDYVTENANNTYTVLMQVYGEDGSKTKSAVSLEVYSYDEKLGVYYVDDSILSSGDILFGSDETTFVVKDKGSLIGVYNINKGYADFKEITILYQNDEYAIVKSNSAYGLRYYDYIALDADNVSDDQFISQSK